MAVCEVRDLAVLYRDLNSGVSALPEEEASPEQLVGIRAKISADVVITPTSRCSARTAAGSTGP